MSFPPETTHPATGGGLPALEQELRAHLTLCGELLAVVQREHQQLKTGQVDDLNGLLQAREGMLERLTRAQETLFAHKETWMALNPAQREKHPERIVHAAVRGMLPKGPLGRRQLKKLKIYNGTEHPHGAQQPKPLN